MTPEAFAAHRPRLLALAYRMLGSVQAADDIVQETWLRWTRTEAVAHPRAWLDTVCTRLCLDEAKRAHRQRETYPGTWLPEPWVETTDPLSAIDGTLTMALLMVLQKLTPPHRAAFLLREVFDADYAHVAAVLDTPEATCRQWVRRAKQALAEGRPRFDPEPDALAELIGAFGAAVTTGDLEALEAQLTADVVAWSDGGGRRPAAIRPVLGPRKVARLVVGTSTKHPPDVVHQVARINGAPGVVLRSASQGVLGTVAFALRSEEGAPRVSALYILRNPDKLGHLDPSR